MEYDSYFRQGEAILGPKYPNGRNLPARSLVPAMTTRKGRRVISAALASLLYAETQPTWKAVAQVTLPSFITGLVVWSLNKND